MRSRASTKITMEGKSHDNLSESQYAISNQKENYANN